jgi:molybdate transport system ATP-binding protein
MIEEEVMHDHIEVITATNNNLKSMSSGEQKKALLHYIISKTPDFIIVDNIWDNLDGNAQESILSILQKTAAHTLIIQIISRKKDILPFVEKVITIKNNAVFKTQNLTDYLKEKNIAYENNFTKNIPPALHTYTTPAGPLAMLNNISVSFEGRQILNNINWVINTGEFWQLAGPNGSGKTTILNLITGESTKGYGQNLFLFGNKKGSGETIWDIKKNIGYVTPNTALLFPRLDTAEKMILSGFFDSIGLYTTPGETQITTANEWLKLINLYKERNQPFCFLPLGKQRMVLVARAMVKYPPLLILDEPTSGLDDENAVLFTALINKIAAESNTAIIYVSHRKEEGLRPQYIFELVPGKDGSIGQIIK